MDSAELASSRRVLAEGLARLLQGRQPGHCQGLARLAFGWRLLHACNPDTARLLHGWQPGHRQVVR